MIQLLNDSVAMIQLQGFSCKDSVARIQLQATALDGQKTLTANLTTIHIRKQMD